MSDGLRAARRVIWIAAVTAAVILAWILFIPLGLIFGFGDEGDD